MYRNSNKSNAIIAPYLVAWLYSMRLNAGLARQLMIDDRLRYVESGVMLRLKYGL